MTWIPAYASPRVFKIGSGDVFSACFAYSWAVAQMNPVKAADSASRWVAKYVGTRQLPLPPAGELFGLEPIGSHRLRPVRITGSTATLAGRWLLEEARWCLHELGLQAYAPALGSVLPTRDDHPAAVLVLADFWDPATDLDLAILDHSVRTIWLTETGQVMPTSARQTHVTLVDDFATAIYQTAWAASM